MITEQPKTRRLVGSYFLTYFLVLIIPVLTIILFSWESIKLIREDTDRENQSLMSQASFMFDSQLNEIKLLGTQILGNTSLLSLQYLEDPLEYPNVQQVYKVKSGLLDYTQYNDLIFDYFLFFDRGQLVLNDRVAYTYEDFYDNYMHPVDISRDTWLNGDSSLNVGNAEMLPAHMVYSFNGAIEEKELISFAFNFNPLSGSKCWLSIFVERSRIESLLEQFNIEEGDFAYIETSSGVLLSTVGRDAQTTAGYQSEINDSVKGSELTKCSVGGQNMLVSRYHSDTQNYNIVVARLSSRVYERLTHFSLLAVIILIVAASLAIVLGMLFSNKNSKLVSKLVPENTMRIEGLSYSEAMKKLGVMYDGILSANNQLAMELDVQKPYLRGAFLTQLLHGDFRTEAEAVTVAENIGVSDPSEGMCIMYFHYAGCDAVRDTQTMQLALNCRTVIQLITDKLEGNCLHKPSSDNDYVLLLSGSNLKQRIGSLSEQIRAQLTEDINSRLYMTVGDTVYQFTDVVRSLNNAMSFSYIQPVTPDIPVLYYEENNTVQVRIFYPQDMRHHIISCIMNGDESGMLVLLNNLKEKNLQSSCLPAFMRQLFIDSLINTLLQAVNMVGFPEAMVQKVYERIKSFMTLPVTNQINEIESLFVLLCQSVLQMKNTKQQINIDEVCDYIHNNYTDVNLSLTCVADRFGVSESYLSGTFKTQNGANFFTYVETLRMDKAKELLRNTSLKIGEIAEQTGYASANSFCRAFKRNTGSSATDYRTGAQ